MINVITPQRDTAITSSQCRRELEIAISILKELKDITREADIRFDQKANELELEKLVENNRRKLMETKVSKI